MSLWAPAFAGEAEKKAILEALATARSAPAMLAIFGLRRYNPPLIQDRWL